MKIKLNRLNYGKKPAKYVVTITDNSGNLIKNPYNLQVVKGTPRTIFRKIEGRNPKKGEIKVLK